jgi:hypothetical protein
MDKKDLQKIIREGFESSSLNEGMFDRIKSAVGMKTDLEKAQQAIGAVIDNLKGSDYSDVEAFLKGEKTIFGGKGTMGDVNIDYIYDVVKGTKLEKAFDIFVKDLNKDYRDAIDRLGDDTLRGKDLTGKLSGVAYPEEFLGRLKLDLERSHKDWLKKREEAEAAKKAEAEAEAEVDMEMAEGSARNQTNFRGANLKPGTYPWVKQIDEAVEFEIIEEEDKRKTDRYMFASNLKQMCRQAELMLQQDAKEVEKLLDDGHDWAQDHVAVAKENLDQVFDFMMNKLSQAKEKEEEIDVDLESEEEMEEGIGKSLTVKKGMNAKPKPNQQKEESLEEDSVEEGSARNLTNKKGMNAKPSSLK